MTQHDLLDQLETELRSLLEQVRIEIAHLPEEALRVRPAQDKWNILECFAHLNAYTDYYLSRIELSIHKAKARKWSGEPNLRPTWAGRRSVAAADSANIDRKRMKAPKRFNFIHKPLDPDEVKRFIISCEKLLRSIQAAREVNLNKPKIAVAQLSIFSLNLGDLLHYLVVHARRHVLQAQRLIH